MAIQIKLKNSVVQDSTPSTSDLPAVGEIALNANINSIGGFMRASDNSIVKIFGPGSLSTPTATTTVSGISELATNSETTTGTATNRVVTPAGLNAVTTAERTTSNTNYVAKAGSTLTGVLTMPNGSNSAPAINFGDSDSGIFGGTNSVSLAAGGTTGLSLDSSAVVEVPTKLAVNGATKISPLNVRAMTDGNLYIRAITDIASGTGVGIDVLNDANSAVKDLALRGATTIFKNASSESARLDSSGRLLVGSSTSVDVGSSAAAMFQVEHTDANLSAAFYSTINSIGPAGVLALGHARGSASGILLDDDVMGQIRFAGGDGVDLETVGAQISAEVDGTPGANDMPGRLVFSTTADGAASPTTRLTINSAGLSSFAGNITTTGTLTVGSAFSLFGENNVRFKSAGDAFIDHNTTGQDIKFRVSNSSSLDTTPLVVTTSGIDVAGTITGTGNVTITKASPVLRLADTTDPQSADGSIGKIEFFGNDGSSGGADVRSYIQTISTNATGNAHALSIGLGESNNAPTEKVRILGDGKIGVNNVAPTAKLHIIEAASTPAVKIKSGTSTNQNTHITLFNDNDGGTLALGVFGSSATTFGATTATDAFVSANQSLCLNSQNASGLIKFGIGSTPNTKMIINSSGNVGIGDVSPNYMLHVTGSIGIGNHGFAQQLSLGNNSIQSLLLGTGYTSLTLNALGGAVGIGDDAPTVLLSLKSAAPKIKLIDSDATGTPESLLDGSGGDLVFSADKDGEKDSTKILFKLDGNTDLQIDHDGRVVVGAVMTSDSGPYYDDITINNGNTASGAAGGAGLSLVTGASSFGGIIFSTASSHGRGYMKYDQANDRLILGTQTLDRIMIEDAGNNGDVHIKTGNIVLDTATRGINFHNFSTGSGITSNLLDDYEEGTWTATLGPASGEFTPTVNTSSCFYTKIGRQVTVVGIANMTTPASLGSYVNDHINHALQVTGLPFTIFDNINARSVATLGVGGDIQFPSGVLATHGNNNNTKFAVFVNKSNGNTRTSPTLSTSTAMNFHFSFTYFTS